MEPLAIASPLATSQRPARGRLAGVATRWPAVVAALVGVPLALLTSVRTLSWPGRTFPGFLVMGNALVPTVGLYEWTGFQAGVPFLSLVTAVDDRPVRTGADVYAAVADRPPGTPIRYTLRKGGQTFTRTVESMRFGARDYLLTVGIFLFCGFTALAMGVAIGLLQPLTAAARAFQAQAVVTGLYAFTGTALYDQALWRLSPLYCVVQTFLPATFLHLGLVFPVEREFVSRRRAWLLVPYGVSTVMTALLLRGFLATPPAPEPLYPTFLYTGLSLLILIAIEAYNYWEGRNPRVRRQLRAIVPGIMFATALAIYAYLDEARHGGHFPINLMVLPAPIFYVFVGYSILRHDLFDIDRLVKRAVVYAVLTLAITGSYALGVVVASRLAPTWLTGASPALRIAFVVFVAVAFAPARDWTQHAVDRIFDRGRLDYRATVRDLSAALSTVLHVDEILDRVGRTVAEGLNLQDMAVVLWQGVRTDVWRSAGGRKTSVDGYEGLFKRLRRDPYRALAVRDDEHGGSPEARDLHALRATLAVPLTLGGRVGGAFALGPRRSGRPFDREDLELLGTLAAQSAVAIENARSFEALEEKVRQRTLELEASNAELARAYKDVQAAQTQLVHSEKMASLGLLVAGVAHEINNPVTFIVANMEPIQELIGELHNALEAGASPDVLRDLDALSDAMAVVARGAERTAAVVTDLRTFSRLGEDEPCPVDLHEGVEVSLRLLRPRWAGRIAIHRDYGRLPTVEAVPGHLNQVFMNLLTNACDAIAGSGNIWLRTTCDGDFVRILVRDDGAGIRPEVLSRVFDPFFTTKSQGRGTGLGLAITHGIVMRMGGTIEVSSEPGRGTVFDIVLPLRRSSTRSRP